MRRLSRLIKNFAIARGNTKSQYCLDLFKKEHNRTRARTGIATAGLRRAQRRKGYAANRKAPLGKEDYLRRMRK
nr:MAG TPA: hypothetical protein [Caudoviricetes sp.]